MTTRCLSSKKWRKKNLHKILDSTLVWLGKKTKLNILALHTVHAAKRVFGIPDFRYYALADGIKTIFKRIGKGPLIPEKHKTKPYIQLSFWNL